MLEKDTIECNLNIFLVKINSFTDSSSTDIISIDNDLSLLFKKGSSIENSSRFYFVWDEESQKYVNEFGFVLLDTGKFFIAQNSYKYENFRFFIDDVPGLGKNNDKKDGQATFYSTFQTTGEGWFQFEVVE
jgi:hypothetical protein